MTVGFYQLAVLLALSVTLPLHAHLGIAVGVSDLIAFPAAACLAIEALRSSAIRIRCIELYRANPFVYWYVGWAAFAAIIGVLRSTDGLKAFKDLIPGIVLYTLVGLTINTQQRLRAIVIATLAGAVIHMMFALSQAWFGGPYVLVTSESLESKLDVGGNFLTNSPVGLFSHPNALGFFLLPVTLFLIGWLWSTRIRPPWLLVGLLAIDLWILKMIQVKGIYAFLAVGLVMMFWPLRRERWRFAVGLVLPVVMIVLIMWFTLNQFLEGEEVFGTLISRLELWDRAMSVALSDRFTQFLGNGYGLFEQAPIVEFEYPNAHNAWLNHILSFGFVGLAFYLGCFVSSLRILSQQIAAIEGPLRGMALAALASLSALLGESFFEPTDRGDPPTQFFLLLAAAVVIPAIARNAKRATA